MATATATTIKRRVKIDNVAKELREIARQNGSRLHPPDVVNAARDPDSVLHSHFTWDDTEAAEQHRLWQARQLIATVRIVIPNGANETQTVRAYHALRSDDNGYRRTDEIVRTPELMDSLIAQFARDLERVTDRYDAIREAERTKKLFVVIEEFCGKQGV